MIQAAKPAIVFLGSPQFGRSILEKLVQAHYPILSIICQPDRPAGRGQKMASPACAQFAKENNLPLLQPASLKNNEELIKKIAALKPDFVITAAYGLFLPETLLKIPKMAVLNIHPSLLPQYRGAAPVNWALLNGDKKTGVTLMRTIAKMDAGPIYAQSETDIQPDDTTESLLSRLATLGAELLLANLPLIAGGKIQPSAQSESHVVLAPRFKKEDGRIVWDQNATKIFNHIRGMNPWPGSYTLIDNKRLKIYDGGPLVEKVAFPAGTIYAQSQGGIFVACKDSTFCIREVQLEGKKRLPAAEFAHGFRLKEGTRFK